RRNRLVKMGITRCQGCLETLNLLVECWIFLLFSANILIHGVENRIVVDQIRNLKCFGDEKPASTNTFSIYSISPRRSGPDGIVCNMISGPLRIEVMACLLCLA